MKFLITAAAVVLFAGMAHADEVTVMRGHAALVIPSSMHGIPYIMPFVSDRTAQRYQPRNHGRPIREGNAK